MELRRSQLPLLLTAIVVMVGVGMMWVERRMAPKAPVLSDELEPLLAKHGPKLYSSHNEEIFARDYFGDRTGGFFVDIGASHYEKRSNTYYLEKHLQWEGVAVDAIDSFAEDYRKHRPRTKYFTFFVSDVSDARAALFIGRNSLFSSTKKEFTSRFTDVVESKEVPTITLTDLLVSQGVKSIDFLTMDIELAEPKALAGFDIERFKPALVCVEGHPEVRQQILDYFAEHKYVIVGKYLRADPQNLWFRPK